MCTMYVCLMLLGRLSSCFCPPLLEVVDATSFLGARSDLREGLQEQTDARSPFLNWFCGERSHIVPDKDNNSNIKIKNRPDSHLVSTIRHQA